MAQFHISEDPPGQRSLALVYAPALLPGTKIPLVTVGIKKKITGFFPIRKAFWKRLQRFWEVKTIGLSKREKIDEYSKRRGKKAN